MDNSTNGRSESRMDRIERLLELYVERNEKAHEEFEQEHKTLLTAQVLLTDNFTKLADNFIKMADHLTKLTVVLTKLTADVDKLTLDVQELRESQDVLIKMMDEWIRNQGGRPQ